MRAFLAIKEIKRRRRAAQRGDFYSPREASGVERPLLGDTSDSIDRVQSFSSPAEPQMGIGTEAATAGECTPAASSTGLGSDIEASGAQRATPSEPQYSSRMDDPSTSQLGEASSAGQLVSLEEAAKEEPGSGEAALQPYAGEASEPSDLNAEIQRMGTVASPQRDIYVGQIYPPASMHAAPSAMPGEVEALNCDAAASIPAASQRGPSQSTGSGIGLVIPHFESAA